MAHPSPRRRLGTRLRVGYYGTFFGSPNWMKLYMGVINAHDRRAFEVHLIADGALPSAEAGYQRLPRRPGLAGRRRFQPRPRAPDRGGEA